MQKLTAVLSDAQIVVINIDAFRKNFTGAETKEERKKSNVFYRESDRLPGGHSPMEFVQATRPIVIIDEPQSADSTDRAQETIRALNPLCTLGYSATHRNPYNLVYRLDPIRAFELRLVKQIVVARATADGGANDAFVRVKKTDYKPAIKAKVRIHVQTAVGPKEKSITVKNGADLFALSNERRTYRTGFEIAEINAEPGSEYIRFTSGRVMRLGEETGGMREDVSRVQIKHTVRKHLEREVQLRERGVKVLSLFFIDRVANYWDYDGDGRPVKGKFAIAFEKALTEFAKDTPTKTCRGSSCRWSSCTTAYFAADKPKKGQGQPVWKDTRGDTQADDEVYNLIMKEKERLLSEEEPLRLIFSHSALREGWDNPNVFQICTLNETRSTMEKRQEIGRGLRLPVNQHGLRVFDESINKLFVMANESYEDFARALQSEYEEDCGVMFGKVPITVIAKLTRVVDGEPQPIGRNDAEAIKQALIEQKLLDSEGRLLPAFNPKRPDFEIKLPQALEEFGPALVDLLASYQIERHIRQDKDERANRLKKEVLLTPEFQALWGRIKAKTQYRVEFATDELVQRTVAAIKRIPKIEAAKIRVTAAQVGVVRGGVTTAAISAAEERVTFGSRPVPDVLAYLQNEWELTCSTLVRILKESGRLAEFFVDPQRFMDAIASILKHELHRLLVDGIKYEKIVGTGPEAEWEMLLFKNEELINYLTALEVENSVYEYVVYKSAVEMDFAKYLDEREDIRLFVKLPTWFEIDTPVGKYNPDWAIVKYGDETLYLVRETKSTKDFLKLRITEADKVRCGQKHFQTLGIPFAVVVSADEV